MGPVKTRYDYPRQFRLRRSADISGVFRSGKRVQGRFMDVIVAKSVGAEPRLAVIVAKRGHSAVERNKVRRRLREIVRTTWLPAQRMGGGGWDLIVRAGPEAYDASAASLLADFERCTREVRC
ncbi:MAG: ribonuclease P protein component [Gemmatimonadota bacterium]